MTMATEGLSDPSTAPDLRYLERREPIVFPESEKVPETQLHLDLRTLLYQLLQDALVPQATVGSDQFVYFDAEDPSRCLAPDVYVRRVPSGQRVRTWKVWERGAPEVAVEIVSYSDAPKRPWSEKLANYRQIGVSELVRFDPESAEQPLRVWDRVEGALVERQVNGSVAASLVLEFEWIVAEAEGMPRALRIAQGDRLVPTRREAVVAQAAARQAAETRADAEQEARRVEQEARRALDARVRELEAELRRRDEGGTTSS